MSQHMKSNQAKDDSQWHRPAGEVAYRLIRKLEKRMRQARRVWLEQIKSTDADSARDNEALHDFRVEIRRLRVWLHHAHDLVQIHPPARRQLNRWSKNSNINRDHEVMLDLLRRASQEHGLNLPFNNLFYRNKDLVRLVSKKSLALKPKVSKSRASSQAHKAQPGDEISTGQMSFSNWIAERLSMALAKSLTLFSQKDDKSLHKLRITIKQIRYLLEPISDCGCVGIKSALPLLKQIQTQLGDIHDLVVLRERLPDLLGGQLSNLLSIRLQQEGSLTRGIQQDFTSVRKEFTLYLHWQSSRYDEAREDWLESSERIRTQLATTMNSLIQEISML